ncbi:serine/threonine-protein phosphatase [Blastococcus saxobsidens]|uniref:Serine/threonine-protein phosphatase n=1 Tax=Blastococcus saxobsidens TaxID=138336 RepID=A0A6L9W0S7_9ACTN|nr:PP2C family protein-serine/threonine phosphatase [Blastococcus saxobsidens]NEK85070.1 serine/threonine-protein phosphatase [Blastococcus saxobsidens]
MVTSAPRRLSILVGVVLLLITAALSFLAWLAHAESEENLLRRQLAQVGTLLGSQATVLQVQLADIGQVAVATDGNPSAFAAFADRQLTETGQSLSLWRVDGDDMEQVALQGVPPLLPDGGADRLTELEPDGRLVMFGILPGEPRRLAYGLMPGEDNTDFVVYGEAPLAPNGRVEPAEGSPLAGLDLGLYLGEDAAPEQLLQATAPVPIEGRTETTSVPFGNSTLTIVGASQGPLTGIQSAALPWVVLGVGGLLALGGAATFEFVSRRRAEAERLAAENDRLYRQQRGIAGTLQHALLPAVPELPGLEVAARYVAGEDELQVGGDWFDVIGRGPGSCVFVVGDISGRGLPAATTMAALRFAVRAYLAEGHTIEDVLARLRGLLDIETDHQFATVLLGDLDVPAGRLRLVSAGHFPPALLADGEVMLVDCPVGTPVGVSPSVADSAVTVPVTSAATMLAFTDGAVERRGETIDTGLDRLRTAAGGVVSRPLDGMLDDLLGALVSPGNKDDTVLLGVRWG